MSKYGCRLNVHKDTCTCTCEIKRKQSATLLWQRYETFLLFLINIYYVWCLSHLRLRLGVGYVSDNSNGCTRNPYFFRLPTLKFDAGVCTIVSTIGFRLLHV